MTLTDLPRGRDGLATTPATRPSYTAKRILDRAITAAAMPIALPVMGLVAIAVKATSPGPALFRQERIGLNGEPFTMLKFRSMVDGAEHRLAETLAENGQEIQPYYKLRNDPRITPIGAFLRKTSLDELPQLLNVLGGSMSLVGPRPHVQAEVDAYSERDRRRLDTHPGLTGAWQVQGRSDLTGAEGLDIDADYVDNWSLTGDLRILAQTILVVIARRGAY